MIQPAGKAAHTPSRADTPLWVSSEHGQAGVEQFRQWIETRPIGLRYGLDVETTGLNFADPDFELRQVAFAASDSTAIVVDATDFILLRKCLRIAFDPRYSLKWYAHHAVFDATAIFVGPMVRLASLTDTLTAIRCVEPGRMSYSLKTLRPETAASLEELRWHYQAVSGRRLGRAGDKTWLPRAIADLAPDDPFVLRYVAADAVAAARLAVDIAASPHARMAAVEARHDRLWRNVTLDGIGVDREGLSFEVERVQRVVAEAAGVHGVDLSRNSTATREWVAARGIRLVDANGKDTLSSKLWADAVVPAGAEDDWAEFCRVRNTSKDLNKIGELLAASRFDGRIHPVIAVNGADSTGRMSVSDPAVQNLTPTIRGFLVADPGKTLVGLDLDQVEPRVVAGLSGDRRMLEAVLSGDVYQAAANIIWPDPPADEHTRAARRKAAKTVLLAQIYGQGVGGLAARLGVTEIEAKRVASALLAGWPDLRAWIAETRRSAEAGANIFSYAGRPLPSVADAPYRAVNYRVQSSAADLFKQMAANVAARLADWPGSRLWLPVHDELVVETPEEAAADVAAMMGDTMRAELNGVPIGGTPTVIGPRWAHA